MFKTTLTGPAASPKTQTKSSRNRGRAGFMAAVVSNIIASTLVSVGPGAGIALADPLCSNQVATQNDVNPDGTALNYSGTLADGSPMAGTFQITTNGINLITLVMPLYLTGTFQGGATATAFVNVITNKPTIRVLTFDGLSCGLPASVLNQNVENLRLALNQSLTQSGYTLSEWVDSSNP
ncbi:hypothetical protein ACFYO1_01075 [Nocardia sp. NPDC006044]|uniref:hypothetical protein n=1 Tax=Nocardia sp. NPDC006044 TaxID=3364306 RepID=UPI0036CD6B8F